MLQMLPVTDKPVLEQYAAEYGLAAEDSLRLYVADQRGECLGVCFYRFVPEGMEILLVDTKGDGVLFDGILRAVMAALMGREADTVLFSGRVDPVLLREWGFLSGGMDCVKSANTFFETCKKCKNK